MTRECPIAESEERISKSLLNNKEVYHKTCCDNTWTHIVEHKSHKKDKQWDGGAFLLQI